jgi:ATP-dependent DNA helicase RecQ
MEAVLEGRDALVILSTGGGKSLCYQAPALLMKGTTLVLSPLIALMKDQVDSLRQAGVRAACLHSASPSQERKEVRRHAESGQLQLLYLAPERLAGEHFLKWITDSIPVSLLAVDEAHCISSWGHDFRPEYRQISVLRERLAGVPVLACTATATPAVAEDIAVQLRMNHPVRLVGPFDRPNFIYRVQPQQQSAARIRAIIGRHPGQAGIVYSLSRNKTEALAAQLAESGVRALPYHAGLSDETRHQNHEAFLAGACDVMVATVAFGMGIDKPDIRFIIHVGMPESLENYQQETGRAGRDGQPAECTLLFSFGDVMMWRRRMEKLPEDLRRIMGRRLETMVDYAQSQQCRRQLLLNHFGEKHGGNCGNCDRCRPELNEDGTLEPRPRRRSAREGAAASLAAGWSASDLAGLRKVDPAEKVAERILSHYARVQGPVANDLVVDALLGNSTAAVTAAGHDRLSTFGVLKGRNGAEVRHWLVQLQMTGNLEAVGEQQVGARRLQLTPTGRATMLGHVSVALNHLPAAQVGLHRESPGRVALDEETLFEALREWRLLEASAQKVPAFIIFTDSVLRTIARVRPKTEAELSQIPGIGKKRFERYGKQIMGILRMWGKG